MTRQTRASRRSTVPIHVKKHFVEHNYHDHLHDPVESTTSPAVAAGLEPTRHTSTDKEEDVGLKQRRSHRGGVAVPFPEKLHYMLSRMDQEGTGDIASWKSHGRCFIVNKPKEFVEEVMPRFFRQTKLTSFQRQLNLYGFSRLTAGPDRGAYYHELFLRGRLDLCVRMVRTRVKGNGSKAASSPSTEPNFYAMTPSREPVHRVLNDEDSCETPAAKKTIAEGTGASSPPTALGGAEQDAPSPFDDSNYDVVIGLPMDLDSYDEEEDHHSDSRTDEDTSMTATTLSARNRSESFSSTPAGQTKLTPTMATPDGNDGERPPSSRKTLPAVVTPKRKPKTLVSPPASPTVLSLVSLPIENAVLLPDLEIDYLHSGDQMFFEGLPFHYLETKDVLEDSLLSITQV